MDSHCLPQLDANGYPKLSTSNSWINVANRLGVLMNHINKTGVNSANVTSEMKSYFNEKDYTGFGVSLDSSPTFTDVRNIIDAHSYFTSFFIVFIKLVLVSEAL